MQDNNTPIVVKVAPATMIVFSILFSPALLVGLMVLWKGEQLPTGIMLCGLYGLVLYWICSPSVELLPGRLIYRALMKKMIVDLAAVRSVAIISRPAPNLVLSGFSDASPLGYFIVKPFSKAGVAAILHHIQTECPEAHFDDVSTDMKTGDFASVTRQTLAARNILRIALASSGGMFVIVILKIIARH